MAGQGVPGRGLVADLRQIVFSQTGHFHDGTAVDTVLEHGAEQLRVCLHCGLFNTALLT